MFMDSDFISTGLALHDSLFKDKNFLANESLKPYNVESTRLILFFSMKCSWILSISSFSIVLRSTQKS